MILITGATNAHWEVFGCNYKRSWGNRGWFIGSQFLIKMVGLLANFLVGYLFAEYFCLIYMVSFYKLGIQRKCIFCTTGNLIRSYCSNLSMMVFTFYCKCRSCTKLYSFNSGDSRIDLSWLPNSNNDIVIIAFPPI